MVRKLNESTKDVVGIVKISKSSLADIKKQLGKINEALEWFDIEVDDIVSGEADVTEDYAIALADLITDIRAKLNQAERLTRLGPNDLPD